MNLTIKNIRARGVQAPLKRPPRSASGEIPNAPLVLIDLQTNEGITGSCYLFAFMGSMLKPTATRCSLISNSPLDPRICMSSSRVRT